MIKNNASSIVIFTLNPYSEEMECVMIQMLQKIYIDCVKDLASERYELQEDIESIKKRRKAAKCLLWYYMTPTDLEDFLNSVKTGSPYVFNAEKYLQS